MFDLRNALLGFATPETYSANGSKEPNIDCVEAMQSTDDIRVAIAEAMQRMLLDIPQQFTVGLPTGGAMLTTLIIASELFHGHEFFSSVLSRNRLRGTVKQCEAAIVDDVAGSGVTILGAAKQLAKLGVSVRHAVVLVDRGIGAESTLALNGITLHSFMRL